MFELKTMNQGAPQRDPRRNPIAGDTMQIGRTFFEVLPQRWERHIAFRHPQTGPQSTHHVKLWVWRKWMSNPNSIVVKRGDTEVAGA